ncbi:UNVERIFIED_CONTAM: hypothetical protein FKN15_052738 [Acipenser sinensis]
MAAWCAEGVMKSEECRFLAVPKLLVITGDSTGSTGSGSRLVRQAGTPHRVTATGQAPVELKRTPEGLAFMLQGVLTGSVEVIHSAKVRVDCRGGKNDLYVKQGDIVEIVRVKNNPEGKWLARTFDGTYGYINNTSVDVDYEEVKRKIQSQGRSRVLESSSGPVKDEDFYDDVGSSEHMSSLDPKRSKKEEKEEKEFRKKFKYEGPIEVQYQMMVDPNANIKKTGGKDLPLIRGEILDVIKMVNDKKAICRNKQGKCMYFIQKFIMRNRNAMAMFPNPFCCRHIYDND